MSEIHAIVMCGGKCGGTTLTHTLRNAGIHCIHIHHFDCPGISDNHSFEVNKDNVMSIVENAARPIYILDSYRLPIERKISSFFQNLNAHLPDHLKGDVVNAKAEEILEWIEWFNAHCLFDVEEYHSIDAIMEELGEPSFQEFDFKKGYNLKRVGNVVFVKLRFQDIPKWSQQLSEIFGRPIELCSANLSQNKDIYRTYKAFQRLYRVPEKYLTNQLAQDTSFYVFNSQEERETYLSKWNSKKVHIKEEATASAWATEMASSENTRI